MKLHTLPVSAVIAVLLGIAQCFFLVFCWAHIAANNPLPRWLVDLGLRGAAFRATLIPIDFLISVAISLPAAYLLLKLRPGRLWLYLLLAVVPGFIWLNLGLVGNPDFSRFAGSFILGWIPELFAIPVATWLLRFAVRPGAPNNSFKPKPLRGSA